ncbi:uncharacterized protein [Trachinotus anak]|uniref:uncharacterized protein n=1 Tax=Trachinotus anak TaxID=443729 RepID=UPI0039F20A83
MTYVMETLPPDILSEVNKAVEEKASSLWMNTQRQQKKRRTVKLKRNTSQRAKRAAKKSAEENVSWRYTQQTDCKQETRPSIAITNPLKMDQMLPTAEGLTTVHAPPILLDKSAVPRGQMLPVCQDQSLSASFQSVENNWMNLAPAFTNPTSCAFTSAMISCSLPQMALDPSSSHVPWDVSPGLVDSVAVSSMDFGPNYSPPEQTTVTNLIAPAVDFTNQPPIPLSVFPSATSTSDDLTPENRSQPVPDALCDPRFLQESDLNRSSPVTDSAQDALSPFWLDLLLNTNNNLNFPDANLGNMVLSPNTGSN